MKTKKITEIEKLKKELKYWQDKIDNVNDSFFSYGYSRKIEEIQKKIDELKSPSIKERGIIYSTEMVYSIKLKNKHETRRLRGLERINLIPNRWKNPYLDSDGYWVFENNGTGYVHRIKCPYGMAHDILYVRESFTQYDNYIIYKADVDQVNYKAFKWKPSIFLKKEDSRFFHKIKSVDCDRLRNISNIECINEGIKSNALFRSIENSYYSYPSKENKHYLSGQYQADPRHSFYSLWVSVHGVKSLEKNPWVWVIRFEDITEDYIADMVLKQQ